MVKIFSGTFVVVVEALVWSAVPDVNVNTVVDVPAVGGFVAAVEMLTGSDRETVTATNACVRLRSKFRRTHTPDSSSHAPDDARKH